MSLQAPDDKALSSLVEKLDALEPEIPYHLWVEQPYVATCLSTWSYPDKQHADVDRENTPTALALVPNIRPKALKKIFTELDIGLWK